MREMDVPAEEFEQFGLDKVTAEESYNWITDYFKKPFNLIAKGKQMTTKNSKQIDRILYLLPICIICGFFIHVWWSNAPATKLAIGLTISSVIFVATFGSLLTGEIGARGFWIVKKQEKPGLFWGEFAIQLLIGLSILAYAFV